MQKKLISIPNDVANRFDALVAARYRSKVISELIKEEVERREMELYNCAKMVEGNETLTQEMMEWEKATGQDGLNESW